MSDKEKSEKLAPTEILSAFTIGRMAKDTETDAICIELIDGKGTDDTVKKHYILVFTSIKEVDRFALEITQLGAQLGLQIEKQKLVSKKDKNAK